METWLIVVGIVVLFVIGFCVWVLREVKHQLDLNNPWDRD